MANKTTFTPEEWKQVLESVMLSGMAVTAADPSGLIGVLKESMATGRNLLAAKSDWPALYDRDRLAGNTVPVAAAVYRDDIYVERELSLETAGQVNGLQVWETDQFHHDGIADDGEAIFGRLLGMVRN